MEPDKILTASFVLGKLPLSSNWDLSALTSDVQTLGCAWYGDCLLIKHNK